MVPKTIDAKYNIWKYNFKTKRLNMPFSVKNGAVFEDLKKIHLEKKALERQLQLSKELNIAVINQPITYFVKTSIGNA